MTTQKRVQAQLLHPQSQTRVANGWVTVFLVQTHELSQAAPELHAKMEFDHDQVDLAGRTLLLRFNDKVSGLVNLHAPTGQRSVFAEVRSFDLEWADARWKDLHWFEAV